MNKDIQIAKKAVETEIKGLKKLLKSFNDSSQFSKAVNLISKAKGKIVFFNQPMDPTLINTFQAYGGANGQRGSGAAEAAKYGAVAVLVRSLTNRVDDFPHTGNQRYNPDYPEIPALAISTKDAELLSSLLKGQKDLKVYLQNNSMMKEEVSGLNNISEIM